QSEVATLGRCGQLVHGPALSGSQGGGTSMIFDLVQDFGAVLNTMPSEQPRRHILALLDEAIRRDVHFIDRHPTTLFQCLWNTCWWYDCPEAAGHYDLSKRANTGPLPWTLPAEDRLSTFMERWRERRERTIPGFTWLR